MTDIQKAIESGKTVLGIELGSTRIKAVLIGEDHAPIASGRRNRSSLTGSWHGTPSRSGFSNCSRTSGSSPMPSCRRAPEGCDRCSERTWNCCWPDSAEMRDRALRGSRLSADSADSADFVLHLMHVRSLGVHAEAQHCTETKWRKSA